MKIGKPVVAGLLTGLLMGSLLPFAPSGIAGGAEPFPSGSFDPKFYKTYYSGTEQESKIFVTQLTGEGNSNQDYYEVANIIRQLEADDWYDYANFWTNLAEYNGGTPDEVDWRPGIQDVGTGLVPFTLGMSWSGGNPSVTVGMNFDWSHQWGGKWNIVKRDRWDPEGPWDSRWHQESFRVKMCWDCDRGADWDTLTHTTTWAVTQGKPLGVWVASTIKYCTGGWDCARGVHAWDPSDWHWFPIASSSSSAVNLACDDGVTTGWNPQGGDDPPGAPGGPQQPKVDACAGIDVSTLPEPPSLLGLVPEWDAQDSECGSELLFPDCNSATP